LNAQQSNLKEPDPRLPGQPLLTPRRHGRQGQGPGAQRAEQGAGPAQPLRLTATGDSGRGEQRAGQGAGPRRPAATGTGDCCRGGARAKQGAGHAQQLRLAAWMLPFFFFLGGGSRDFYSSVVLAWTYFTSTADTIATRDSQPIPLIWSACSHCLLHASAPRLWGRHSSTVWAGQQTRHVQPGHDFLLVCCLDGEHQQL
jgi:hypothetical protein